LNTTLICKASLEDHPILDRFLTIGEVKSLNFSYEEFLCHLLGVKPNPDYPLASVDYRKNQTLYYLYADPVYLSLQRDTFFFGKKINRGFYSKRNQKFMRSPE